MSDTARISNAESDPVKLAMTPSLKSAVCCDCTAPFRYVPFVFGGVEFGVVPTRCDRCDSTFIEKREREIADGVSRRNFEAAENRRTNWETICPPRFLATDLNHPTMRQKASREALAWQYGPAGLLMVGETDTGKSRVLYELCRRVSVNDGRSIAVFGATDFAFQLTKSFADGNSSYCHFIERLRAVDVLALDDLGKERITERVQSELFGLVDWRMNYRRPIIVTTNYVRELLAKRFMDADTAWPLIRRLVDSCQCIAMTAPRHA